jgi:hypothetical protein
MLDLQVVPDRVPDEVVLDDAADERGRPVGVPEYMPVPAPSITLFRMIQPEVGVLVEMPTVC